MTHVRWLTLATSQPMGQQNYEQAIMAALVELREPGVTFEHRSVGSFRSRADLRVPWRALEHSEAARRVAGRAVRGAAPIVHRFDLRIPPSGRREVVTAHDLPPARFSDEGTLPPWAWRSLRGTPVICPSSFAKQELAELLGADDVTVIPYGVRSGFLSPAPAPPSVLVPLGIRRPFVLHAAGASVRKSLKALANAWRSVAAVHPDIDLVLCGPDHPVRTSLFGHLPQVVMAGPIPLAGIPALMAAATVVVVPSTYEGFGLPALEAMAVGTPAVVANAGALPEVVGDGALVVEPDASSLADGLMRAITDTEVRGRLTAAGHARAACFSWQRAAEAHVGVYERAMGHG